MRRKREIDRKRATDRKRERGRLIEGTKQSRKDRGRYIDWESYEQKRISVMEKDSG